MTQNDDHSINEVQYDLNTSNDFAKLLNLIPISKSLEQSIRKLQDNGIPLFSILEDSITKHTRESEKWICLRNYLIENLKKEKFYWRREYIKISNRLIENGIRIYLFKTYGPFPFWSGNIDCIVREDLFKDACKIIKDSGMIRIPTLDEPYKVIFKKFLNGRAIFPIHLHSRISWHSTYVRGEVATSKEWRIDSSPNIAISGKDVIVASNLAHAFIENSCIRIIDLQVIDKVLSDENVWTDAVRIAESENWTNELLMSAILHNSVAKKCYEDDKPLFGNIENIFTELKLKDRLLNKFIRRIESEPLALPLKVPWSITKSRILLRSLKKKQRQGYNEDEDFLDIILQYIRRKLSDQEIKGMIISISGPDGSGKTTLSRGLQAILSELGITADIIWSRYGTIMPGVQAKLKKSFVAEKSNKSIISNIVKANIKLGFSIARHSFRCSANNFLGKNIILDRSYFDDKVDFILDTSNFTSRIMKIGDTIIPSPSIKIILEAEPDVLSPRSLESLSMVAKKHQIYRYLIEREDQDHNLKKIDATISIGEILDILISQIIQECS
mgnify:CR=1 FL=1